MKTLAKITGIMILASLMLAAQPGFAQQTADRQEQQSYHIKIIKDENGKQEVIDKTFASQPEMDAYMKDNKLDAPPTIEPPMPPATPVKADTKEKKIVISESEEANGHTSLDITYENYSAERRAELIQKILNEEGNKVKVEIVKQHKMDMSHPDGSMQTPEPPKAPVGAGVKEPDEAWTNLTDVKVFPNPATGQFHLSFGVGKAADVKLLVTDLNGKEVYTETFKNYTGKFEKEISSANLTTGTYIVDVQAGGEKNTIKVVMQ
jgi:hypothetical protein